jgi:hypothetical protein
MYNTDIFNTSAMEEMSAGQLWKKVGAFLFVFESKSLMHYPFKVRLRQRAEDGEGKQKK